jgi:transcriptional regulator with XRE-family HTH domain
MSTFLDRLRIAATHAGVSDKQADVARALGMSRQVVNRWYVGGSEPGSDFLVQIAERFGVQEKWLQNGEGSMLPEAAEDLTAEERDLIKNYRTATPKVREVIRTVVRAARKVAIVIVASIPPLQQTPSEAATLHKHICAAVLSTHCAALRTWLGVFARRIIACCALTHRNAAFATIG